MKGRAAAWVVWSLTALTVLCTVIHVILWTLAHPVEGAVDSRGEAGLPIAFVVVGALVVTRRPDNRIGWLFCAGAIFAVTRALDAYALYALAARPEAGLPGATAAAWVAAWSWALGGLLVLLLPLLYPTGRLLSPRWRPLAWLAGLVCLLSTTSWAFRPGPLEASEVPVAPNPVGIPGPDQLLEAVDVIAATLSVPVFLAAVASVVVRFRRARGIERQQLKWFVYASLVVVAGFTLSSTLPTLVPGISELVLDLVATGLSLAWPVALGIAILRYRLYDIDRLINRTLVYGLVTVLLGLGYAACVVVLGQLFGQDRSTLAVAGATLAAAALFQPGRRRIQQLVDRRFNRRRSDMAKTVEAFSARLRDQLDLDTLSAELLAVADQTMQPTTASLWLRPPTQVSPRGEGQAG